jgi:hypothetical protein
MGALIMNISEKRIKDFDEYIDYTENLKGRYYFRGQADLDWAIAPSLFRYAEKTFEEEKREIQEELKRNPKLNAISALFDLQHYGKPTRICDLTISPLSALFFATESEDLKDGVVYVLDKTKEVSLECQELNIIMEVLTQRDFDFSSLSTDFGLTDSVEEVLSKNYLVQYKDLLYNNTRSYRQGGLGIVFGFTCDNGFVKQRGTESIDSLYYAENYYFSKRKEGYSRTTKKERLYKSCALQLY